MEEDRLTYRDYARFARLSDEELLRQCEDISSGKEYETRKSFLDKVKELFNG